METELFLLITAGISILVVGIIGFYLARLKYGTGQISQSEFEALKASLIQEQTKNTGLQADVNELKAELVDSRESSSSYRSQYAALKEKLEYLETDQKKKEEAFIREFENLSNKILKNQTEDFQKNSTTKLETLLNPLKENLVNFSKRIDENREKSVEESTSLKVQIQNLTELNHKMSQDAINLTLALKGESKTRGDWGEMILETILEQSGLEKGVQYETQASFKGEEGNSLRPDVVINLPDNKQLVVDSKLSLVAYNEYCQSEDEGEQANYLKVHLQSVKTHVKDLSSKDYHNLDGINSIDFTLMFVPIEPALNLALQHAPEIYHDSLKKGIAIVTPSTLMATLKIIYHIWRQEKQNDNAKKIAELGGKLYDKLSGFVSDLETIGTSIDKSKTTYDTAFKKLHTGKGNAIGLAEKMKEMGAVTNKALPAKLLDG